eukprot:scaffold36094_cov92-Phaeocystis_antarctica.AAC.1
MKGRLRRTYCLPSNMFVRFLSDVSVRHFTWGKIEKIYVEHWGRSYDLRPSQLCDGPSADNFLARMNLDVPVDDYGQPIASPRFHR